MNLKIKEGSENYCCTVISIGKIFSIPDADRIVKTVINGNDVIVGKDTKEGDTFLYFCAGTQLSADFCFENNLYDSKENNKDTEVKGYVSFNKRMVRSLKLKKVVSNGLVISLSSLGELGKNLKLGDTFTDIGNVSICLKYVPPITVNSSVSKEKQKAVNKVVEHIIDKQFRFHNNTPHLAQNINSIRDYEIVFITRKYHGSSGIVSHCLVKKDLKLKEKLLKLFKINIPTEEYGFVWSSGKPKSNTPKGILAKSFKWATSNLSFYENDIWKKAYDELKDSVEKGVTIYFEIIGDGIQGPEYTYGFNYKILVYRITVTNVDGNVVELGWPEVINYCKKYNLTTVEMFDFGEWYNLYLKSHPEWENSENRLEILSKLYLNKSYSDCKIDEGVCIRVASNNNIFKLKSPNFVLKENKKLEENVEPLIEEE